MYVSEVGGSHHLINCHFIHLIGVVLNLSWKMGCSEEKSNLLELKGFFSFDKRIKVLMSVLGLVLCNTGHIQRGDSFFVLSAKKRLSTLVL